MRVCIAFRFDTRLQLHRLTLNEPLTLNTSSDNDDETEVCEGERGRENKNRQIFCATQYGDSSLHFEWQAIRANANCLTKDV